MREAHHVQDDHAMSQAAGSIQSHVPVQSQCHDSSLPLGKRSRPDGKEKHGEEQNKSLQGKTCRNDIPPSSDRQSHGLTRETDRLGSENAKRPKVSHVDVSDLVWERRDSMNGVKATRGAGSKKSLGESEVDVGCAGTHLHGDKGWHDIYVYAYKHACVHKYSNTYMCVFFECIYSSFVFVHDGLSKYMEASLL